RRRLRRAGPLRRGACRAGLTGDRVEPAPIVPQVIHAMTFVHVGSFFGPTDESLRIYRWGESSGALELVGASTDGVENPLYLATDRRRRFLYVADCGPGSTEGSVSAYMIDAATGNLHLTEEQRRRRVQLLCDCADLGGLPADPEYRSAFVSYIEWGTRLAVI